MHGARDFGGKLRRVEGRKRERASEQACCTRGCGPDAVSGTDRCRRCKVRAAFADSIRLEGGERVVNGYGEEAAVTGGVGEKMVVSSGGSGGGGGGGGGRGRTRTTGVAAVSTRTTERSQPSLENAGCCNG